MKVKILAKELVDFLTYCNIQTTINSKKRKLCDNIALVVSKNDQTITAFLVDSVEGAFYGKVIKRNADVVEEGVIGVDSDRMLQFIKLFEPNNLIEFYDKDGFLYLRREVPEKQIKFKNVMDNVTRQIVDKGEKYWQRFKVVEDGYEGEKHVWKNYFTTTSYNLTPLLQDSKTIADEDKVYPIVLGDREVRVLLKSNDGEITLEGNILISSIKAEKEIRGVYAYAFDGVLESLAGKIKINMAEADNLPLILERQDDGDGIFAVYFIPARMIGTR